MSLGTKIKENRSKLNVTQEELGKKLHVSRQTISNWEVGRSYPDIESLILLSDIFNLSLDKLLREDTNMVSSLKKRKVSEVIYISLIVFLIVGGLISAVVDLIINQQFTWSLIVSSSCLFSGVFISIFKYSKSYHLLKASILSGVFLFILFLAIKSNIDSLDFALTLKLGLLWFLFYMFIIYLIELSNTSFWNILILMILISIPIGIITRMLTNENLLSVPAILSNLLNILILGGFIVVSKFNLDKGRMNSLLTNYREYTQMKK